MSEKREDTANIGGWPEDMVPEKHLNDVCTYLEIKNSQSGTDQIGTAPCEDTCRNLEAGKPLIVLKPKFFVYWLGILMIICVTLFYIVGVIIPVLMTGDYAAVWPVSDKRIGVKTSFFFMAWGWIICIPYFIPIFNRKKICFYNDRVEVHPYLFKKIIIISFSNMRVNVYGNYRLTISKLSKITISRPLQYLNNKFIESITFSQRKANMYDHELIKEAMNIIKERASEYNIKPIS